MLLRSPNGTGSQPDLSKLGFEVQKSQGGTSKALKANSGGKRRLVHECDISTADFDRFRGEMTSLFREFMTTQNGILHKISEDILSVKEEIKNLQQTTQNIILDHGQIKTDITELRTSQTTANNKIEMLESTVNTLKNTITVQKPLSNDEIFTEVQERYSREKNLIVVGVQEANGNNRSERSAADAQEVTKFFKSIFSECPDPVTVQRLGKYTPNKNRPIKVSFLSRDTVLYLLKMKVNQTTARYRIYSDQTVYQQNQMKCLRDELNRRIEDGERDLVIKFIKGNPKIVSATPKN